MKKIFLIAGEISGDSHGAGVVAEWGNRFQISGLGGPKLKALAPEIENWLDDAAVLGLWEVLKKYSYFKAKMEETVRRVHEEQPDAVVFV
ncbi:MAG: lipid-A-disaccharide synthase, partial [Verrucomicrobiota bacterium]